MSPSKCFGYIKCMYFFCCFVIQTLKVFDIPYALSANDDDKLLLATMMEAALNTWSIGGDKTTRTETTTEPSTTGTSPTAVGPWPRFCKYPPLSTHLFYHGSPFMRIAVRAVQSNHNPIRISCRINTCIDRRV